ncbi:hypothetical protein IY145_03105 [Methylosinus sp. H3A]|uniref:hypothetical protein n=1 Tax=Methylosinus sp. H3A TaxID=2785786 RepID=UPI0018C2B2A5|nr:hypothetical protein [Methylosinus sp. H3A]MBG0808362.1 hypothetical protein [Methylosinus sp. H3A]
MRTALLASLLILLLTGVARRALAVDCPNVDVDKVKRAIGDLSDFYGDVPSCLDCQRQSKPIERLICQNSGLRLMEILDTKAAVYAYENATKTQMVHSKPDCSFIRKQLSNNCADAVCVCANLKEHTNDSRGGESPYSGETR